MTSLVETLVMGLYHAATLACHICLDCYLGAEDWRIVKQDTINAVSDEEQVSGVSPAHGLSLAYRPPGFQEDSRRR